MSDPSAARVARLSHLPAVVLDAELSWTIIHPHTETSSSAGGHEELFLVLRGHATFTVDGSTIDAPEGTVVFVEPRRMRSVVAVADDTAVLAIGGSPGAALPVSAWEHWYAASPAHDAGDYAEAIKIATAGLVDHPTHAQLNYQLACFHALAGHLDDALAHLSVAAEESRYRAYAQDDEDFAAVRSHPRFPRRAPLAFERSGNGAPLLLLHAGIADRRMFDPQWATWRERFQLTRCDFEGYGDTPMPSAGAQPAARVVELLDVLGTQQTAVLGSSLGGSVALELAIAVPERVSALVLVCSGLSGHDWSAEMCTIFESEEQAYDAGDLSSAVEINLSTWVDGPRRDQGAVDAELRSAVGVMIRRGFELQSAALEAAEQPLISDVAARLSEIVAPTLVVIGDEDVADMQQIADRLAHEIPGAELVRIAAAAHLPSLERPELFAAAVVPFLAKHGG